MTKTELHASLASISFIGLRGIDGCETLELHEWLTGLVGNPGGGKTTLLRTVCYALLPDARMMHVREISNLGASQADDIEAILGAISPQYGYAIVALDLVTGGGGRTVLGIQIQPESDGMLITRWLIRTRLDPKQKVAQLLCAQDGDRYFYPPVQDLRKQLAKNGHSMVLCSSVSEYAHILFEAGIIPTPLSTNTDKSLFARLIEATFLGGLSNDVVLKLKDYLLPPPSSFTNLIEGLLGCMADVSKTRAALNDNQRELDLLDSTYKTGRDAICAAIGAIRFDIVGLAAEEDKLADALAGGEATKATLSAQLATEQGQSSELQRRRDLDYQRERNAIASLERRREHLKGAARNYQIYAADLAKVLEQFEAGERLWKRLFRHHPSADMTGFFEWQEKQLASVAVEASEVAFALADVTAEIRQLELGLGSTSVEAIAALVGGRSVESVLATMASEEVGTYLAGLRGQTNGVVGGDWRKCAGDALDTGLTTMWIGRELPSSPTQHHEGWITTASTSGRWLLSESHVASFSREGRQTRLEAATMSAITLTRRSRRLARLRRSLAAIRGQFFTGMECISVFLSHRAQGGVLRSRLATMQKNERRAIVLSEQIAQRLNRADERLSLIAQRFAPELGVIETRLRELERKLLEADQRIEESEKAKSLAGDKRGNLESQLRELNGVLGDDHVWLHKASERFSVTPYSTKDQTGRLYKLRAALPPETVAVIDPLIADPNDHRSIVTIWPLLVQSTIELVSLAGSGTDGGDLFESARARRRELDRKLAEQQEELRINFRTIRFAIESTIASERHRIEKIAKFGKTISFGNVTGIGLCMQERAPMMEILSLTEELPMPADATESFFDLLQRFFRRYDPKISYSGEELLDYRNYVDLTIEIRRRDGAWSKGIGVSGTEAIGAGVAFALMLYRGLASQGRAGQDTSSPVELHPIFIIDEIARIEVQQDILIEFAKREGFKLLVSAQSMKASLPCQLYDIARQYDPESLTIRAIRLLE